MPFRRGCLIFGLATSFVIGTHELGGSTALAAEPFLYAQALNDAKRYQVHVKRIAQVNPGKRKLNWVRDGDTAMSQKKARQAQQMYAAALLLDDKDSALWLKATRAILAIRPGTGSERYDLPARASGAAYRAYQVATSNKQRARALAVLATTLVRRSYYRPALEAYKASLKLVGDSGVQAQFNRLRQAHGFRVTNYNVESNSQNPRLCVQFSEILKRGDIDFSKYFSVNGKDPSSVKAEQRQVCVGGLRHGERFEVSVRGGLPSELGENLTKSSQLVVYVKDRDPSVRFSGRSYVLPSKGQQGIPVTSVNVDALNVKIYRVGDRGLVGAVTGEQFRRQFSTWDEEQIRDKAGAEIWKGSLAVRKELNEDVTTAFPVGATLGDLKPGVYVMTARVKDSKNKYDVANQWFIVSDLGLSTFSGSNGLHVFVRSLENATAKGAVNVRLLAKNNEVLGEAKTDAQGYARFDAGLTRGKGGSQPAVLSAQGVSGDYAFLDLTAAAFDFTDRGVAGRTLPGPVDGFVFTERGVYRPGEEVNVTGLVRDKRAKAVTGVSTTLVLKRPDGKEYMRRVLAGDGAGGRTTAVVLGRGVMTGTWRAKLYTDPKRDPVGETTFLVEDFVPERMALDLSASGKTLSSAKPAQVTATGKYLYGPPAANVAVEGEILVRARTSGVAGFKGYKFGLESDKFPTLRESLSNLGKTNANGVANVSVELPKMPQTTRLLEAKLTMRLREPGGRTIERGMVLPVGSDVPMIGVKPAFEDATVPRNSQAQFSVVALDRNGATQANRELRYDLFKIESSYQWYSRNGSWKYERTSFTRREKTGVLKTDANGKAVLDFAVRWGQYRLEVTQPGSAVTATSMEFSAGWYAGEDADTPEKLDVALDKAAYAPGETAQFAITSDYSGRALVTVLGNGVELIKDVAVKRGVTSVALPVADWGAGAYVAATLFRPMKSDGPVAERRMPGRSIGLTWLKLDPAQRALKVTLTAPAKLRSGEKLSVPIKVSGAKPGQQVKLVLSAVDVGILNLTRFKAPDPTKWYFGQQKLDGEYRDLYGRLIDGMRAAAGAVRSGGDGGNALEMSGNPTAEETVSLFSGLVTVNADGTAVVDFDVPEFNGTLRLTAVAWSADGLGSSVKNITVRDKVALLVSTPRFLHLGDVAQLGVDLHNIEAGAGTFNVSLVADGAQDSAVKRAVALETGQRQLERLSFTPTRLGQTEFALSVEGPDGVSLTRKITLDVKPPAQSIKRRSVRDLIAGSGSLVLSKDLIAELVPDTVRVTVSVGRTAGIDVPGLLTALDRYPYGCTEQTTSRALPLLYLNQVATATGMATDKKVKTRIAGAIKHLFNMQDTTGAFGLWNAWAGDLWLTAYATDFLTRAKEQGFEVPKLGFNLAIDRLRNFVSYSDGVSRQGEAIAYALYVLARNGRAPIGDLRYYADTKLDEFKSALSQAHVGAALGMLGDKDRAERVFAAAVRTVQGQSATQSYRADYGSKLRDSAGLLTLVSEAQVAPKTQATLRQVLQNARASKTHTSTQENAWMLLAANAMMKDTKNQKLDVNGQAVLGAYLKSYSADELAKGAVTIRNLGGETTNAVVTVTGDALTHEPAVANGFTLVREYYTLDGEPVDLAARSATGGLEQNDRFVVVLKIASTDGQRGRVLLEDRLPAGFVIENPRLVDSGNAKNLPWLKTAIQPSHSEFRDDRFVASFNMLNSRKTETMVAYVVRATHPGTFSWPAARIEDMYRPSRFARTDGGKLSIVAR